jgi:CRISPR-associated protein Cas2
MELTTYVFYDIEDDRIRAKVTEACFDYGLMRLQYSVFVGPLSRNRREEIYARLTDLLSEKGGKLIVQPVCEADVKSCRQIELKKPPAEPETGVAVAGSKGA